MDPRLQRLIRSVPLGLLVAALTISALGGGGVAAQQTGNIAGRILDQQSGEPIASAQVYIEDLNLGVLSQQDGRYILLNVPTGEQTVSFERIGYRRMTATVTVTAGETVIQDFQVSQDALQLDEVIVTGTPGGTQRRAIGNAVSRLDAQDITADRPITNMQDLLQGRTPGVAFTRTGGQIGEGAVIRIRGVSSFSLGSQPLIYIDGVRMDNSTNLGPDLPNTGSGASGATALSDVNPNDIESIEIIKGPAAATLYGTEASAGVIQIITKKGQTGAPRFDAQVSQGSNFILNPRAMIGDQYHCTQVTGPRAGLAAPAPCEGPDKILEKYNIIDMDKANGFGSPLHNGYHQSYDLSVRGGTDVVNYFASVNYGDDNGVRSTNWNHEFTGRANLGLVASDQLKVDISTGYTKGKTRFSTGLIASGGLWPHMMWAQGRSYYSRGYLGVTPEQFDIPEATRDFERFTGSVTMTHDPFSWLDHRLTVGIDRGVEESQNLFPRDINGSDGPFGDASLGQVTLDRPINTQISVDYAASFKYSPVENFQFTTSFGAQYYSTQRNRISTTGLIFAAPAIRSIEGATTTSATQSIDPNKSLGFYAQQEIGWKDRIFVTGALRGDGNSAFGENFDAAYYPKVSATWVISEEPFWNVGFMNSLRLRGAWGKSGRQPGTFDAVTVFSRSIGSGGTAAIEPSRRGNPDVGPEVGSELELGFDMALFQDRVSTEFTYFYQKTTNALVSVPLAPSDGFPGSQAANLGRLDNWGYEASLNARAFQTGQLSFDLGVSFTYTMNEIKDLGGRQPTNSLRLGLPWPNDNTNFIESGDFVPGTHFPTNLMCDSGISMAPNPSDPEQLAMYGWKSGGPVVPCGDITDQHQILEGPNFSPWVWSVNGTLTYGDAQVYALIDAEQGRWLNDFDINCRNDYCGFPNSYNSLTQSDPVFVASSRYWYLYPADARQYGDYDASYVRLRELGLRYTLPEVVASRVGASSMNLSFAAHNLWYLWRKQKDVQGVPIPSPEIANPSGRGESSFSLFQWPPLSTIQATLRVTF